MLYRLSTIEIMADLGGVIVLYSYGGVVQRHQRVLLRVPRLRGVLFQTVKDEYDVFPIQLQQPRLYYGLGEFVACRFRPAVP